MMAGLIALAFGAGVLVTLSRQINGRLALASSALGSSFWNHAVGLAVLLAWGLAAGGLWPAGLAQAPLHAWLGGPLGVVFIAGGSWLIPRIGAVMTGILIIAGQMLSGVILDLARGAEGADLMRAGGVAMILAGVWISRRT